MTGAGSNGPGWHAGSGHARIWSEPVLVVGQRPVTVGGTSEYPICTGSGERVGSLVDVGRDDLRAALRPDRIREQAAGREQGGMLDALRQFSAMAKEVPYRLQIRDPDGAPLVVLTGDGWEKRSTVAVTDPAGRELGQIVEQGGLGRPRFAMLVRGERVGEVLADQWWTVGHRVTDRHGEELALVAPSPQGWLSRARRAKSASFVVRLRRPLDEPLRSLVFAAAVGADTALKRPEPGSSGDSSTGAM